MDRKSFYLCNDKVRFSAVQAVRHAPRDYVVEIKEPTRSLEQNKKLHAMLTDISEQKEWAGAFRNVTVWKRLMVAAWLRANNEHVQVLPAIDGNGVDIIYEHTSKMTIAHISSLIEYLSWWGADNGIKFSAPESWGSIYESMAG